MEFNARTRSLVSRAIVEARIIRWYKRPRNPPPQKLLSELAKPKKGLHVRLSADEREHFIGLIRTINRTKRIILEFRRLYSRRLRLFYEMVFGFPPRKSQSVEVIWGAFTIHFVFGRNDLIAFWRRVQWGPGSGGYYSVGDRDIKVPQLRGLISFGREANYSIGTREIVKHESIHAFEDYIKNRRSPPERKRVMYYIIKSELNACLHNFKYSGKRRRRLINESSRCGLTSEVKETIEDYLSYTETIRRIRKLKIRLGKSKTKKERRLLRGRLKGLKERLHRKRLKRSKYMSLYRKTVNQVIKALNVLPVEVLRRIIYETPFERLPYKIPESVRVYRRMKYEWYRT